jgi:hypothetical protein
MSSSSATVPRRRRLGDPQDCTDSADTLAMNRALYDALVCWGPQGEFQPALAESWSVSRDCRTWTFTMRAGVDEGGPVIHCTLICCPSIGIPYSEKSEMRHNNSTALV